MVVPKQHRQVFASAGWGKREIREYIYETAQVRRSALLDEEEIQVEAAFVF